MKINKKCRSLLQTGALAIIIILFGFTLEIFRIRDWESYLHKNYLNFFSEFDASLSSKSIVWRLERRLIQYTIIQELTGRKKGSAPTNTHDEIKAVRDSLLAFRSYVRSQSEVPHLMLDGPAIVTGLGWCNQINEDAAIWLAQKFGVCYVISIYDPETKSGHTIGRLKSRLDQQWIYFDIWPPNPYLFKVNQQGTVENLYPTDMAKAASVQPELNDDFNSLYALAYRSPVTGTFPSTYIGYLITRLTRIIDKRPIDINIKHLFPSCDREHSGIYIEARLAHLKGYQSKAKRLYESSANLSKSGIQSVLGSAAENYSHQASN